MVKPSEFFDALISEEIDFFTGVPDSLLKDFCSILETKLNKENHIKTPNEGSAIGVAIGYHAASGKVPLVYMQNSGIGNAVNPILSLADPKVMATPIVLLIGWRGEMDDYGVQRKDEPQHVKQGQITPELLTVMGIPFKVVEKDTKSKEVVSDIKKAAINRKGPSALLVRHGAFLQEKQGENPKSSEDFTREIALQKVLAKIKFGSAVISTTGMLSRELFEFRQRNNSAHRDLLSVGGMGHAISIAIGVAIAKPEKNIICLDGDGALLMHMGILSVSARVRNLTHILFNNKSHDSVGGQPTCAPDTAFSAVAKSLGYDYVGTAANPEQIQSIFRKIQNLNGSKFIEIICNKGNRRNLTRPNIIPAKNFSDFSSFLGSDNEIQ